MIGRGDNVGSAALMRITRCALAFAALVLAQISLARAAEQVDLLLALAMDVSRNAQPGCPDHPL
jgi:hypothetical protein